MGTVTTRRRVSIIWLSLSVAFGSATPVGVAIADGPEAPGAPQLPGLPQIPGKFLPQRPFGPNGQMMGGNANQAGAQAQSSEAGAQVSPSGDITLNFVNADVRDVAKAVLGDYLKLNYEISTNVQGSVTIQTSQPLSRKEVLPALEQALGLTGLALVHSNGLYEVMPLADAHRQVGASPVMPQSSRGPLGYGVEVVKVKYVSAVALEKLLEPIASSEGTIRVDSGRNLLIIEGTAQQRQTLLDDIALFDADWLTGMSFALFEPNYMDAEELAKELDSVVGGIDSPIAGVVHFVPIDRLNAVLAISAQPRYIDQLKAWVARLDRPGQGNDKKIFVYRVQNGRASDLCNTLLQTLFGSGASSAQAAAQNSQNNNSSNSFQSSNSSTNSSLSSGFPSANGAGGSTNTSGSPGGLGSANTSTPMRSGSSAVPFQPATSPIEGANGNRPAGRPFETVGGVSREGISSVNITADETNNALVILATPREYAVVQDALRQLDTSPVQVLLEAAIAEVSLTKDTQFGFQYFYQPRQASNNTQQIVWTNSSSVPAAAGATLATTFPGFAYMFTNGDSISAILSALGTTTHVETLSSPEVMVLNNQTASLEVGDQVPIVTATAVSTITTDAPTVNSVEYLDTGVILKVTPRVNRGGQVMMDVSQEVSGVTNTTSSSINSPTIQQRKISSSVSVEDGETVALGGLFTNQVTKTKNGIPYLQDIPYLGNLFTNQDDNRNKDELIVLITPHVIDDTKKAQAITQELRHRLPEVEAVLEQKP